MKSLLLRGTAGLGLLLAANGCGRLNEFGELGNLADTMRTELPLVSEDLAATCERQSRLIVEIPAEEKTATDKPQDCAAFREVAGRVAQDQTVLIAYFEALAKLWSPRRPSYEATVLGNLAALNGYVGLTTDVLAASTAAQELLGRLTELATHRYRSSESKALVRSADPAVQRLTAALTAVMTKDYPSLLESEENLLRNYYEGPMAARKGERLALILVQRQYDGDAAALVNRRASAVAYGHVMRELAATHAQLAAAAGDGKSDQARAERVGRSVAMLKVAIAQLAVAERR